MKKVFDMSLVTLAVIGIFIIIGVVGKMDYMTNSYMYYPLIETVKGMVIGCVCIIPAGMRYIWR